SAVCAGNSHRSRRLRGFLAAVRVRAPGGNRYGKDQHTRGGAGSKYLIRDHPPLLIARGGPHRRPRFQALYWHVARPAHELMSTLCAGSRAVVPPNQAAPWLYEPSWNTPTPACEHGPSP